MKIQLLLALRDTDYSEHLSRELARQYSETFIVKTCSTPKELTDPAANQKIDVALLDSDLVEYVSLNEITLPFIVVDEKCETAAKDERIRDIRKYQRISSMVGRILECYAEVGTYRKAFDEKHAKVTVVWSPIGGCGKTTTALAYCAHEISRGEKTVYVDLEPFSSTSVYFAQNGKSVSSAFEKLDGNVELLLQSIQQTDTSSGISYYCQPSNYDDINIIDAEDVIKFVSACMSGFDEVVVDLGSDYSEKTIALFDLADSVLIPIDQSKASQEKFNQFRTQNDEYTKILEKTVIVLNKGARVSEQYEAPTVSLPVVQSNDPTIVYKTLSAISFP